MIRKRRKKLEKSISFSFKGLLVNNTLKYYMEVCFYEFFYFKYPKKH